MFIARLICSDPYCATQVTAEAETVRELETLSCECGYGLEVLGWPDWEKETARMVLLPQQQWDRGGFLPEAA